MENEIENVRKGFKDLLRHYENREEELTRTYSALLKGNLLNKILMWIDVQTNSGFKLQAVFPLLRKDPIYILVNELLNYIDLDKYDSLMILLNDIVTNNRECLYRPVPKGHRMIVEDVFHLDLARLMLQAYDREFGLVKEILLEFLERQHQSEEALFLIRTIKQIGKYYYKNSEFDWATYCLDIAIDLSREQSTISKSFEMEYAFVLNLRGLVELGIGRGPIEYFTEALEIFKQLGNTTFEIYCYQNLGIYYWRMSDYEMSEKYMRMAHELHKEVGNIWGMASTLSNLGVLQLDAKNFEKAKLYDLQAIELYNEIKDVSITSEFAMALLGVAESLMYLGEFKESEDYFKRTMSIFQEVPNVIEYYKTVLLYVGMLLSIRRYPDALRILNENIKVDQIGKQTGFLVHFLYYTSYKIICKIEMGDHKKARIDLEEMSKIEIERTIEEDVILFTRAYVLSVSDDLHELADAESILRKLIKSEYIITNYYTVETYNRLAQILWYRYNISKGKSIKDELVSVLDNMVEFTDKTRMLYPMIEALMLKVKINLAEKSKDIAHSISKLIQTIEYLMHEDFRKYAEELLELIDEYNDEIMETLSGDHPLVLKIKAWSKFR